jgi:hypothetical protein
MLKTIIDRNGLVDPFQRLVIILCFVRRSSLRCKPRQLNPTVPSPSAAFARTSYRRQIQLEMFFPSLHTTLWKSSAVDEIVGYISVKGGSHLFSASDPVSAQKSFPTICYPSI